MKVSSRKTLATAMAFIMALAFVTSMAAMNVAEADTTEGDIVDIAESTSLPMSSS